MRVASSSSLNLSLNPEQHQVRQPDLPRNLTNAANTGQTLSTNAPQLTHKASPRLTHLCRLYDVEKTLFRLAPAQRETLTLNEAKYLLLQDGKKAGPRLLTPAVATINAKVDSATIDLIRSDWAMLPKTQDGVQQLLSSPHCVGLSEAKMRKVLLIFKFAMGGRTLKKCLAVAGQNSCKRIAELIVTHWQASPRTTIPLIKLYTLLQDPDMAGRFRSISQLQQALQVANLKIDKDVVKFAWQASETEIPAICRSWFPSAWRQTVNIRCHFWRILKVVRLPDRPEDLNDLVIWLLLRVKGEELSYCVIQDALAVSKADISVEQRTWIQAILVKYPISLTAKNPWLHWFGTVLLDAGRPPFNWSHLCKALIEQGLEPPYSILTSVLSAAGEECSPDELKQFQACGRRASGKTYKISQSWLESVLNDSHCPERLKPANVTLARILRFLWADKKAIPISLINQTLSHIKAERRNAGRTAALSQSAALPRAESDDDEKLVIDFTAREQAPPSVTNLDDAITMLLGSPITSSAPAHPPQTISLYDEKGTLISISSHPRTENSPHSLSEEPAKRRRLIHAPLATSFERKGN